MNVERTQTCLKNATQKGLVRRNSEVSEECHTEGTSKKGQHVCHNLHLQQSTLRTPVSSVKTSNISLFDYKPRQLVFMSDRETGLLPEYFTLALVYPRGSHEGSYMLMIPFGSLMQLFLLVSCR